jgi:hypothetical protein
MPASPDCRGLYIALCLPVLGSQRTTSASDRRTQVLVVNCYLRGNYQVNVGAECMGAINKKF